MFLKPEIQTWGKKKTTQQLLCPHCLSAGEHRTIYKEKKKYLDNENDQWSQELYIALTRSRWDCSGITLG